MLNGVHVTALHILLETSVKVSRKSHCLHAGRYIRVCTAWSVLAAYYMQQHIHGVILQQAGHGALVCCYMTLLCPLRLHRHYPKHAPGHVRMVERWMCLPAPATAFHNTAERHVNVSCAKQVIVWVNRSRACFK